MTQPKERSILFSAPMVRAILDGRKTQTRRVWKMPTGCVWDKDGYDGGCLYPKDDGDYFTMEVDEIHCPYGREGSRLWVRESFWQYGQYAFTGNLTKKRKPEVIFLPFGQDIVFEEPHVKPTNRFVLGYHKRPSIFMTRWASRIDLLIKNVRVERLQDISEADAIAEGLKAISKDGALYQYGIPDKDGLPGNDDIGWNWQDWEQDPRDGFKTLFQSINGVESWDKNPWVWVIEFERIKS